MQFARFAGPVGVCCALSFACADPSGPIPVSPSATASTSPAATEVRGGNGKSNGQGNGQENAGANEHGNGNPNGNRGNGPPAETPGPPTPKRVELEGLIEAIVGQVLTVDGQNVVVPPTVIVHHGGAVVDFTALQIGDRVHVKARLVADVLTAEDVKLQNPAGDGTGGAGDTELTGLISGVVLACPTATFTLDGQTVTTDAFTAFDPVAACAALVDGTNVHVDGNVQLDLSILATEVTVLP